MQKQFDLTKAGAWIYDIQNQERTYLALSGAYAAGNALLAKYTLRAPIDGVVLSVHAASGSYISPQGAYDSYTQGFDPVIVMGSAQKYLEVRAYIDEVLVGRLPAIDKMEARMFIQGTDVSIPLTYDRTQPYVSPRWNCRTRSRSGSMSGSCRSLRFGSEAENVDLYPGELVWMCMSAKNDRCGGCAAVPRDGCRSPASGARQLRRRARLHAAGGAAGRPYTAVPIRKPDDPVEGTAQALRAGRRARRPMVAALRLAEGR